MSVAVLSKKSTLTILLGCAIVSCSKPIEKIEDLDGCYFNDNKELIFSITKSILKEDHRDFESRISIVRNTEDSSIVNFSPGIEITFGSNNKYELKMGNINYAIFNKNFNNVYTFLPLTKSKPLRLYRDKCL